jgi:SAM-dependent methyltransferase
MISWYRLRLREHGFFVATLLLFRAVWARAVTTLVNRLAAEKVTCPCCGWQGRRFYDYLEVGFSARAVECPRCNSHPRHRLFALWLKDRYHLEAKTGTALVFAPERALEPAWKAATGLSVVRTDIESARGVQLLADIQRLPLVSNSIDLIWCHHVLTQIPDDRAAIHEMHRVLRPNSGELVVSVAHEQGVATREFGEANIRYLYFWRIYGDDFAQRLVDGGFQVEPVRFEVNADERERYGIGSGEGFFICTKLSS